MEPPTSISSQGLKILAWLASAFVAYYCFSNLVHEFCPPGFGAVDLMQYWAGARLFLEGRNPYDHFLLLALERTAGLKGEFPVILWNPPTVFPFIFLFAYFSFEALVSSWAFLSVLLFVGCALLDPHMRGANNTRRAIALAFFLTFYPIALCLAYGQIGPILLLATCGSFYLIEKSSAEDRIMSNGPAGLLLSLTLLKPHLLYLLYIYILISSIRKRQFGLLGAFCLAGAVLSLLPVLWNPRIVSFYLESLTMPPIYWRTPTLGSWIQDLSAIHTPLMRLLPTVVVAVVSIPIFMRIQVPRFEHLILLIPISLFTSPYGWPYDQILLLPVALFSIGSRKVIPVVLLFLANAAMLLSPAQDMSSFVWYPLPFVAATLLSTMRWGVQSGQKQANV